jgi:hypothetical protein
MRCDALDSRAGLFVDTGGSDRAFTVVGYNFYFVLLTLALKIV